MFRHLRCVSLGPVGGNFARIRFPAGRAAAGRVNHPRDQERAFIGSYAYSPEVLRAFRSRAAAKEGPQRVIFDGRVDEFTTSNRIFPARQPKAF